MDYPAAYDKLISSKEFKQLGKDYYLVHVFKVPDQQPEWEFGFYNQETDKIIVFDVDAEIKMQPASDVFKEKRVILPLHLEQVKTSFDQAMVIAKTLLSQTYKAEVPSKIMVLLQHLDTQVWNITVVCMSLSIINIRIDAANGQILSHKRESLLSWKS
jgi:hypothetical protein